MHVNQRETTLAYIAGIIDGEAYVGIQRVKAPARAGGYLYMPMIKVNMVDPEATDLLKEVFGGWYGKSRFRKDKLLPQFIWQIQGRLSVMKALKLLLPYLRVKKNIANVVMEYCEGYQHLLSHPDEFRRREKLFWECRRLVHRMPATTERDNGESQSDSLNLQETARERPEEAAPASMASNIIEGSSF